MTKFVPDRWQKYKPFGNIIKGTKILPFKVPLRDAICRGMSNDERFTTKMLLQAFPRLKCIVDLTNTRRYYDYKDFKEAGVRYEKIMVPGKQLPPMDMVKRFFKVMDDFLTNAKEEDIIGVHCTHGINRTGYLICRYLVQQLNWNVAESMHAFEEARGYSIERELYVTALKEVPKGKRIDTKKIRLTDTTECPGPARIRKFSSAARSAKKLSGKRPYAMGPHSFTTPLRSAANDGPFPPPSFGYGGPFPPPPYGFGGPFPPPPYGFGGPFPPPPFGFGGPMPPPPPPGMSRSVPPMLPPYGPRSFRYGPPMRLAMPPPGPGYPSPTGFAPRMPASSMVPGPSRLPPSKMKPPPPPTSAPLPLSLKRLQLNGKKKQQHVGNGIVLAARSHQLRLTRRGDVAMPPLSVRRQSKIPKKQDFTADTFEENLIPVSTTPSTPTSALCLSVSLSLSLS